MGAFSHSVEQVTPLLNRIKLGLAQKPCREGEEPEEEISCASELALISSGLWMTPVGSNT